LCSCVRIIKFNVNFQKNNLKERWGKGSEKKHVPWILFINVRTLKRAPDFFGKLARCVRKHGRCEKKNFNDIGPIKEQSPYVTSFHDNFFSHPPCIFFTPLKAKKIR
jgi:hypothetical protein